MRYAMASRRCHETYRRKRHHAPERSQIDASRGRGEFLERLREDDDKLETRQRLRAPNRIQSGATPTPCRCTSPRRLCNLGAPSDSTPRFPVRFSIAPGRRTRVSVSICSILFASEVGSSATVEPFNSWPGNAWPRGWRVSSARRSVSWPASSGTAMPIGGTPGVATAGRAGDLTTPIAMCAKARLAACFVAETSKT